MLITKTINIFLISIYQNITLKRKTFKIFKNKVYIKSVSILLREYIILIST